MYSILYDYFDGIVTSCRINTFVKNLYNDAKLFRLTKKIVKYNLIMHFLPVIVLYLLSTITNIDHQLVLKFITFPINIFSTLFHILHYMDLVNIVTTYSSKNKSSMQVLELISLALTMSIYQIVIYLSTNMLNFLLHDKFYYVCLFINYIILALYHSFYCYNNLWQYKKIDMGYRIDIHEKLWPYYFGYGTIPMIIYQYAGSPLGLGCYNIYMILVIALPFMIRPKYPSRTNNYPDYPAINLTPFAYITSCIFFISKFILSLSRNSN